MLEVFFPLVVRLKSPNVFEVRKGNSLENFVDSLRKTVLRPSLIAEGPLRYARLAQ